MSEWMETLLRASRDAAVLSLMIGLLLVFVGRYLPAGWRHGLWLLVAARLLMLILPESPVSMQRVFENEVSAAPSVEMLSRDEVSLAETSVIFPESVSAPASSTPAKDVEISAIRQEPKRMGAWEILFRIWILGVVGVLGLGVFYTRKFSRRLRLFSSPDARQLELEAFFGKLGTELGFVKMPGAKIFEAVDVPALYGLFRPVVLVPPSVFEKLSAAELRLVLMHELGHWRRHDLWVNFLLAFLQAVNWFNPLVWWAFHRARIESERATDAWVLRRAGAGENTNYGGMLLRLLDSSPKPRTVFSGIVSVVESPKDLKRRMMGIVKFSGKKNRLAVAGLIVLLLGLATVGLTQAPAKEKEDAIAEEVSGEESNILTCLVAGEGAEVYFEIMQIPSGEIAIPLKFGGMSDVSGEYRISVDADLGRPENLRYSVFMRHPDYGTAAKGGINLDWKDPKRFQLSKGFSLKFRVIDEKNNPVENLNLRIAGATLPDEIRAREFWGDVPKLPKGFWNATTDVEGRCIIEGLPAGRYYVDHDQEKYGQFPGRHHAKFQYVAGDKMEEIGLKAVISSSVSGTVRYPDGNPVAGARVKILEHYSYVQGGCSAETTTDIDGRYTLQRLLPSSYDIKVIVGKDILDLWTADIKPIELAKGEGKLDFDFELEKGGVVKGRVTLGDTGAPVPNYQVGVTTKDGASPLHLWWVVADGNGFYQHRIPAGNRKVYPGGLNPKGYTTRSGDRSEMGVDLEIEEGGTYENDFALLRENTIRGIVVDKTGNPISGAQVTCFDPPDRMSHPMKTESDDQGRFSFILPAGTENAGIFAEFKEEISKLGLKFALGEEARVVIGETQWARVSGRVLDAEDRPIEGVIVAWSGRYRIESIPYRVTTDSEGKFESKILPGDNLITFWGSKEGYGTDVSQASFKEGETVELAPITLNPTNAELGGVLVDLEGKPVANAQISASGYLQSENIPNVSTDDFGKFVLTGLVDGWLDVQIQKSDKLLPLRLRTGNDSQTIVFRDKHHKLVQREPINFIGKPAPPLVGET